MAQALRIDDLPFSVPLPAELAKPPAFEPAKLSPEILSELRRRADAARGYLAKVDGILAELADVVLRTLPSVSKDTLLGFEISFIRLAEMELNARESHGEAIASHQAWRKIVVELMEPSSRAAWLGYLDPFIEAMRRQIDEPRRFRRMLYDAIQERLPGYFRLSFDDLTPERTLNSRAAEFFRIAMSAETDLDCQICHEVIEGDILPVVQVHVPHGIKRPHRVYADAEAKAFDRLAALSPRLCGRVAVEYVKASA